VDTHLPHIYDKAVSLSYQYRSYFNSVLYCKSFAPAARRTIADELAWKWSETTGKFIGCPFWSVGAKNLFDREVTKYHTRSLQDAWTLAECLASNARNHDQQITHEHVFPKQHFCTILISEGTDNMNELRDLFYGLSIGCVVLESEHRQMPNKANRDNPWRRYEGIITLVENPAWPEKQKRLIAEAKLQVMPL